MSDPLLHKFEPAEVDPDGMDLDKCNIEAFVLHHYKAGRTLHEIEKEMSTKRQAQFFTKLAPIK